MACGSAVTELALGLSIEEARKITREQVAEWLDGLPAASGHAAQLAVDTLKQALGSRRL
jgi:nitrogen fixation NifU-like protein